MIGSEAEEPISIEKTRRAVTGAAGQFAKTLPLVALRIAGAVKQKAVPRPPRGFRGFKKHGPTIYALR